MKQRKTLRWFWLLLNMFPLILGYGLYFTATIYYDFLYLTLVFIIWIFHLKLMNRWFRQMLTQMFLYEFSYPFMLEILCTAPNWRKNRDFVLAASVCLWMQGEFDRAYQCLDGYSWEDGDDQRYRHFEYLIQGWNDYRLGDRESLEKKLVWEILEQPKKISERAENRFVRVMKIWDSFLGGSMGGDILKFDPDQGSRSVNTMTAYWYGIWYSENGDRENAAKQFQAAWRYGRGTQLARNAKSWLLENGVRPMAPFDYGNRAFYKMIQKSGVALVLAAGLILTFFLVL